MFGSLNFSIASAIPDYQEFIKNYPVFFSIFVAIVILGILLKINREKTVFKITFVIFVFFTLMIFFTRKEEMFTHFFTIFNVNFYQNLYFYCWNMILLYLLFPFVLTAKNHSKREQIISLIYFVILTTNVIFQYYISSLVNHQKLLVLGNTYPMIMVGNFLSFTFYFYLFLEWLIRHFQGKD